MKKYFQQGLLTAMIVSLAACGGSSGGDKKTPTPPSSAAPSSVASSLAEASSSSAPSSVDASSSDSTSSAPSSVDASSSSAITSSSGSTSSAAPALTGVFLDNVVAGINYRISPSGREGITSAMGEYSYDEGDSVTFYIGSLELPEVPAKGVVTPADIATAAHTGNNTDAAITKTNILQLLQTLDKDGDPTNGIQIPETAGSLFTGSNVPDVKTAEFDVAVASLLPEGTTLVEETDALAHFESALQSQLLGSWVFNEGEGENKRNVLSFIDSSRYVIIHEHDDEESQRPGSVEFGTYELDLESNELRVRLIGQSDEHGGLFDEDAAEDGVVTHTVSLDGTTLLLGTPLDGQATFTRVMSPTNPFIGGWSLYEAESDSTNVLTFLSENEYVIAHTNNQESYVDEPNQPLSGEFGTYTLIDKHFKVTDASIDTNGEGGLYNRENPDDQLNETMVITPWADLQFGDDNEGTFSFMRLGNFAADLQDFDEEGALGSISATRDATGFSENYIAGSSFTVEVPFIDGGIGSFLFVFNADLDEDGIGNGTVTASEEGEEDEILEFAWHINSTGTVIATLTDEDESFTLAIAKLVGSNSDTESKVLVSLESEEESSLWESKLIRNSGLL